MNPIDPSTINSNPTHELWLTTNKILSGVRIIRGVKMDINDLNVFLENCVIKGYVEKREAKIIKQAKAEWKIKDEGKLFLHQRLQLLEDEKWFFRNT